MNNITSLYTPGTGLPDFEMRIALGLCATALNCLTPEKIKLVEQFDRYVIEVEEEKHKVDLLLTKALGWLCQNRLSDEKLLIRIPGFRQKWLEKQARRVSEFGKRLLTDDVKLTSVFVERVEKRKGAHVIVCGHNYSKAEKIMDALLSFSPHLGKPPKRNNCANIKNLPLCPFCIAVGLAGTVLFQVDININHPNRSKKEQIFFLPHFRGQTRGEELAQYLAITKHIDGNLDDIPAPAALLTLLSLYPHLADLFGNFDASFFIGRADSSGNAPRYGYQAERAAWKEIKFLKYSVYNRALIQDCYRSNERSRLLGLFAESLQNFSNKSLLDFARTYVGVKEAKVLLPMAVTDFVVKEAFNMDKLLLDGENFDVIKEISDMLQYFVKQRNFGYVDSLRKARNVDEFSKLLLDAQREAQSIILDQKKRDKPFLPRQSTIRKMLLLLSENEKQFRAIQTLVALLAFTYYKKEA